MISLLLIFALLSAADAPAATSSTTVKGADTALLGEVRRLAERVEGLRGENFSRPPIAVRAPDVMRQVAAKIRAYNVLPRERLEARGRSWSDVGLGGPQSPAVLFTTLAADLPGIGYDPEGNRLLVAPDRLQPPDMEPREVLDETSTVLMMTGVMPDESVVAHLLMHVRQMERGGKDSIVETTDELLAVSAWHEGEANLVAMRYLFEGLGLQDAMIQVALDPRDVLGGSLFPETLDLLSGAEAELVRFVYLEGFAEAGRNFASGGWPALDEAMAGRRTTRDLLHPEATAAPAWQPTLEDPGEPGLIRADVDTLGEQAIFVLLSTLTGKENLALQGADGWIGDRLERWEGEDGEGMTRWVTRWSGPDAAGDFVYALGRTLTARFPDGSIEGDGAIRTLQSGGKVFRIQTTGAEVRVRVAGTELDGRLEAAAKKPE